MSEVWEPLAEEINLIGRPDIKAFVKFALESAPDYFWTVPASTSGKYHPEECRKPGGLVYHTRMVVYFVQGLMISMECEAWRDELIAAAILHDVYKNGDGTTKYGANWSAHGVNLAGHLRKQARWGAMSGEHGGTISPAVAKILDLTARHMQKWGGNAPRPASMEDWCLAIADYISSRKCVKLTAFKDE